MITIVEEHLDSSVQIPESNDDEKSDQPPVIPYKKTIDHMKALLSKKSAPM